MGEQRGRPSVGLSAAVLLTGLVLLFLAIGIMVFPPHSDVIGVAVGIIAAGAFFLGVGMFSRQGVLVLAAAVAGLGFGVLGVVNGQDVALDVLGTTTDCEVLNHTSTARDTHRHRVRCPDGREREVTGTGEAIPTGVTETVVLRADGLVKPMFEQDRSRNRRLLTLAAGGSVLLITLITVPVGLFARRRRRDAATG